MKRARGPEGVKVMAEKKRVYLMRHAKPELPMNGRVYYGQTDYPLSAHGIAAAEEVGEYLKGKITFDYLYASDMIRAQQTARLVAPYLPITTVPALREVNLGEWEGRGYDEVREQFREIYEARGVKFAEVAPPGGETFGELQRRTVPAFEEILSARRSGAILIVAHGAAIWSIMARCFGLDLNDMFFFSQDYCGIHVLEPANGRMRIYQYNWLPLLKAAV